MVLLYYPALELLVWSTSLLENVPRGKVLESLKKWEKAPWAYLCLLYHVLARWPRQGLGVMWAEEGRARPRAKEIDLAGRQE